MAPESREDRTGEGGLDPGSQWFHEDRHQNLVAVKSRAIAVCGAGALGGTLVESLARMGFSQLTTIDRDRVETRNLSTQPYARAEVGSPKARALANSLFREVNARVTPVVIELTAENAASLLKDVSLIVDAFDNTAARSAVSAASGTLGTPCLHVGFSGDGVYGSGLWEPGYSAPGEAGDDPCDYPLTRPFAMTLAALAARSVVHYLLSGEREDFELTWNDARVGLIARSDTTVNGAS